jgi:hypothetical protein
MNDQKLTEAQAKAPVYICGAFLIEQLDATTWELYTNGSSQIGQYSSVQGAKAAARRQLPSYAPRMVWTVKENV